MTDRLTHILERTDSRHLSKLWLFYRDYYPDDESCLDFLHRAFMTEPTNVSGIFHELDITDGSFISDEGTIIYDSFFIPRRMLNTVQRLISAARDMEQIRKGKDMFKIVFLVTCVETLQKLSGSTSTKKDMLFHFFENFTSEADKLFIVEHFSHDDEELVPQKEDSFKQFIGALNEFRNCATHEGEYWDFCFNNNQNGSPMLLILNIDLDNFSLKHKKEHCFQTMISYNDFESIFIRTCISFIDKYVAASK